MAYSNILVLGAGALGLYYGGRLAASGRRVVFLARGENLTRLRAEGLSARSVAGDFKVASVACTADATEALEAGPYDLVLVTLKAWQATDDLLGRFRDALAPGGVAVTLQNGVDSAVALQRVWGGQAVVPGIAFIGAERTGPGHVEHTAAGHVILGESDGGVTQRLEGLVAALGEAAIDARVSEDIRRDQWRKLIWNASFNGMTALTGTYAHELLADDEGRPTVLAAMREVIAVARALGVALDKAEAETTVAFTEKTGPVRTSMLVDREHGRRLEVEALYGPPVREGRRLGVPVPTLEALYAMLRVVDQVAAVRGETPRVD